MSEVQSQTPESNPEWEAKADRLYRYIYNYLKEHSRSPSRREMVNHMGCSTETHAQLLNYLEQNGRGLHRIRGRARQVWVPLSKAMQEE